MKATIAIKKEVDVRYMKVDAGVRYWEDASVNGQKDVDMYECKGSAIPMMPFAVKVKEQPTTNIYSDHYRWQPTIDVENGCIVDWPKGTIAHIHYKVCDDGTYALLDKDKNLTYSHLKPRDSWVLTPPHGYLSRLPRLTRTPQRGNALPQNVVSSMQVAVVVPMTHRTSPLPIMQ